MSKHTLLSFHQLDKNGFKTTFHNITFSITYKNKLVIDASLDEGTRFYTKNLTPPTYSINAGHIPTTTTKVIDVLHSFSIFFAYQNSTNKGIQKQSTEKLAHHFKHDLKASIHNKGHKNTTSLKTDKTYNPQK